MKNRTEETCALLENRQLTLSLFRHAFAQEPDAARVALLANPEAIEAIDVFATPESALANLVEVLRSVPKEGSAAQQFVDQARAEYLTLFFGPQKAIAPFWESVYLDPRELLFLESTSDVKKRYEAEGYRIDAAGREAEDSIAYQLDFISRLAQKTFEAYQADSLDEYTRLLESQLSFERDHLLNWLPLFAQRAQNAATSHLYPALCAGVSCLISIDADILQDLTQRTIE